MTTKQSTINAVVWVIAIFVLMTAVPLAARIVIGVAYLVLMFNLRVSPSIGHATPKKTAKEIHDDS